MDHGNNPTRDVLLDLNGMSYTFGNYTVTIKAVAVTPSKDRPHGLDYCLVLLNRRHRVFGIDNAHAINLRSRKVSGRKIVWDHQHKEEKVLPYDFISPEKLLQDFWEEFFRITGIT